MIVKEGKKKRKKKEKKRKICFTFSCLELAPWRSTCRFGDLRFGIALVAAVVASSLECEGDECMLQPGMGVVRC